MAIPDVILNNKMDDISKKLDRQNSLYLAHSGDFKDMMYSFLEQISIVEEVQKLEKSNENNKNKKKIDLNMQKLKKSVNENKKRILVFGDETTIKVFGYFTNFDGYIKEKKYNEDDSFLMLFIIRGFLLASLRGGLNFNREDKISSFLMLEVNDYYTSIKPREKRAKELTDDFSKEIGLKLKW